MWVLNRFRNGFIMKIDILVIDHWYYWCYWHFLLSLNDGWLWMILMHCDYCWVSFKFISFSVHHLWLICIVEFPVRWTLIVLPFLLYSWIFIFVSSTFCFLSSTAYYYYWDYNYCEKNWNTNSYSDSNYSSKAQTRWARGWGALIVTPFSSITIIIISIIELLMYWVSTYLIR